MNLTFSAAATIHGGGNDLNLSGAEPQAIARLRSTGCHVPLLSTHAAFRVLDAGRTASDATGQRFSGIAYSGGMADPAHWGPCAVDLESTTISPPLPLLHSHDHTAVVGVVNAAANDGRTLTVNGELFADLDQLAADIAAKAARGITWQLSIGLFDFTEESIPAGHVVEINTRTFAGPLIVMRSGIVREVSIVALGADSQTNTTMLDGRKGVGLSARVPMPLGQLYRRNSGNN